MSKSNFVSGSVIILSAFLFGAGISNIAHCQTEQAAPSGIKIAVVDVNKVVAASSQVKGLKANQDAKREEMVKWLETVKGDIQKQTTDEGKAKLAKKYDKELAKKQDAIRSEYKKKLTEIDAAISKAIADTAKVKGYDIVLSKSAVLYGGDDLTAAIQKVVK